ncbi:mechanosensitive ion channel family protein [Bacillus litorisediminis]|uniref:mechanosensitive ion channel family protein n=1 Tax=Bacillus litorisediminis TaxID=2922713 RepID=UPI001FAB41FD|nr:mechanosensitive ion channel family protein [Bacillus litorisediminis]
MIYIEKFLQSIQEKLLNEQTWIEVGQDAIKIILILVLAAIFVKIAKSSIAKIFVVRSKAPLRISERREATLLKLMQNVTTYIVYFLAIMMILDMFMDIRTIIAGAGIVGLAVGFGAQSLVKDIISGFFIIFEDQFSVGDYVRINQAEGTVEEIGLRITKIKSWTGELHIFPNGSIVEVTNFSIHNSLAIVDISIAYEGDIQEAEKVITEFLETLPERYPDMVKTPELLGVQMLGASEVVLRVIAETKPMKHMPIARALRKELKTCLDAHGIEIPFPRMVMYTRNEKQNEVI